MNDISPWTEETPTADGLYWRWKPNNTEPRLCVVRGDKFQIVSAQNLPCSLTPVWSLTAERTREFWCPVTKPKPPKLPKPAALEGKLSAVIQETDCNRREARILFSGALIHNWSWPATNRFDDPVDFIREKYGVEPEIR